MNGKGTIKPIAGGDDWILTFLKGIQSKVKLIAGLKFELVYNDVGVKCV